MDEVQNGEKPISEKEVKELATLLFQHIEGQLGRADVKAKLTLAVNALLGVTTIPLVKNVATIFLDQTAPFVNRLDAVFTFLMALSVFGSVYYALVVARPVLKLPYKQRQTFFYFGHIVQWSEREFIEKFTSMPAHDLNEAILSTVYAEAQLADRKFAAMRRSINFLIAAMIFWAAAQAFLPFTQ